MDGIPPQPPRYSRVVEKCAICGGASLEEVAKPGPHNLRIVACTDCGLFISTPTLPFERMQIFYCEEFEGDAGSAAARGKGKTNSDGERQRAKARRRDLPLLLGYLGTLKGKTVLDLRSRGGALAAVMQEEGAAVFASDPMLPNVELCARAGLKAFQIGVFEHADLSQFRPATFDAITGLTIHVLAHLPEPDAFLRRAFELLKPGGYLLLDEKDLFRPAHNTKPSIFANGIGHFYHFTRETLSAIVRKAGFEEVTIAPHAGRRSAFFHLIATARKPLDGRPSDRLAFSQNWRLVQKEIARAERAARIRAPINRLRQKLKGISASRG